MKSIDGIMGLVVGDAFGVPFEFKDRNYLKKNPASEMIGYGTHNQPPGTWSDDSSLTLCLLESLTNGLDFEDMRTKFILWKNDGYMTAYDEIFDIGYSTTKAIERMEEKTKHPWECGGIGIRDNGNGSLMRVLPLAYHFKNREVKETIDLVEDVSSMTHAHIISKIACNLYVLTAINLLNGDSPLTSLYRASNGILKEYNYTSAINDFERILSGEIERLCEESILSTGYVIDTLEASIWCWLTTDNYKDCILKAANLGGDTDTICAIAGGLAGIQYGYDSIPKEWIENIAKKDMIEGLCDDFDHFVLKE